MPKGMNYWKGNFQDFFHLTDELRTTVAHPYIAKALNKHKLRDVLDFGCGQGDMLFSLVDCNEIDYVGYDPSERCIENAKEIHKEVEYASFTDNLHELQEKKFDAVILSFVLVTIDNLAESRELIKSAVSCLKPDGTLLFCETHPCFRDKLYSTMETNMNIDNYHKSFYPLEVTLSSSDEHEESVRFNDYHKNMSDIFELIISSGLNVSCLKELYDKPNDKCLNSRVIERYRVSPPPFLYLEAIKI